MQLSLFLLKHYDENHLGVTNSVSYRLLFEIVLNQKKAIL